MKVPDGRYYTCPYPGPQREDRSDRIVVIKDNIVKLEDCPQHSWPVAFFFAANKLYNKVV